MKKCSVITALFLTAAIALSGSALAAPGSVEASDRLPEGLADYISDEFEKSNIPGMCFEIVDENEVLFQESYGEAESCDQQFILGSLSKSFTAVAIMQLEEQGLLSVNDPVAEYLPEFDQSSKTTLHQLLTHTSGMKTSDTMEHYESSDEPAPYTYSNQNYNLLGRIVEEVSGESYGDYIKAHIFKPLGMSHSYVSYDEAASDNLIDGSRNFFGYYYHKKMPYPANMTSGWMTVSAAYIISTANDMGRYLQWYINGSHPEVLSEKSRSRMFMETEYVEDKYEYGYGWGVNYHSGEVLYMHGGNVENYTTYMIIIPEMDIGIIALTNSCDVLVADGYTEKIPENVAQLFLSRKTYDIGKNEFWTRHLLYDLIMLAVLGACCLPALRFKKWSKKSHSMLLSSAFIALFHILLPTLMLTYFSITIDRPLYVVQRFAPDVFIILCAGAALLYCTGICKIIHLGREQARLSSKR